MQIVWPFFSFSFLFPHAIEGFLCGMVVWALLVL